MVRCRQLAAVLLILPALPGVAQPPSAVRHQVGVRPPSAGMVTTPAGFDEQHPVRTHFVLERWLNALGGRDKLSAVHGIYVKAVVVSSGQVGTMENWQTADGKYKTIVSLGDHEFTTVCDGRSGWASSDGAVEDLAGNTLAAAVTRSYLGSYSQFFPDRRPGSVQWVREDQDAYVILLLPAGGIPVTFYLDKTTGLPLRHEMADAGRTFTFYYLEWKDYDGLKALKRGRQTSGPDAPDLTVSAQDVSLNPTLDPKLFQKPGQ